jgi:hypothetical protein
MVLPLANMPPRGKRRVGGVWGWNILNHESIFPLVPSQLPARL